MTLVEKRNRIHRYCSDIGCDECKLRDGDWSVMFNDYNCLSIDTSPESDLDKALAIIADIPENDPVDHPSHYTDGQIETIEFIEDKKLDFCLGNAVKYISRAGKKDPTKEVEDLKKAIWYVERRIKQINGGVEND